MQISPLALLLAGEDPSKGGGLASFERIDRAHMESLNRAVDQPFTRFVPMGLAQSDEHLKRRVRLGHDTTRDGRPLSKNPLRKDVVSATLMWNPARSADVFQGRILLDLLIICRSTGQRRPVDQEDYCSKCHAAHPKPFHFLSIRLPLRALRDTVSHSDTVGGNFATTV